MKTIATLLISLLFSAGLYAGEYTIDKTHSRVGFQVKHLMVNNVHGSFDKFDGKVILDKKGNIEKLSGTVKAQSIDTKVGMRDDHLKSADFFDAEKYPEINLVFKKYKGDHKAGKLTMDLTMRGITKPVVFDVNISETVKNHKGQDVKGLSLSADINRKDFKVGSSMASKTVSDTVTIQIGLEVVKTSQDS